MKNFPTMPRAQPVRRDPMDKRSSSSASAPRVSGKPVLNDRRSTR